MLVIDDNDYQDVPGHLRQEKLAVAWFEVGKRQLERETDKGRALHLKRVNYPYLRDKQVIYQDEKCYIAIDLEPCDSIVLQSDDAILMGKFCFDVGNRHLPIFVLGEGQMAVAYDGRLYDALANKYGEKIKLMSIKLPPELRLIASVS
ncbi:urease accessory protein UreE [Sphingobacterium paludis]|uniref:Urease accessory protein n=1 Tax=Sphingobacterium paludis TaxID=1476465 RepID=A0A4R7CYA2_9SPHI|nr:urease accessory protein UreE [Sphingobacterium paludis]TDS13290.1 urease accessory protein [Sphingobacterium paludis]